MRLLLWAEVCLHLGTENELKLNFKWILDKLKGFNLSYFQKSLNIGPLKSKQICQHRSSNQIHNTTLK